MIRFIFVCMALVAVSILTVASQYMVKGVEGARDTITARNAGPAMEGAATAQNEGPSFEEIYAMMPAPSPDAAITDPAALNDIETAAGGDDFPATGFTGIAPKALADEAPVIIEVTPVEALN